MNGAKAGTRNAGTAGSVALVIGLLAVLPASFLSAQNFPASPPAPMPLRPVRFPPFVNGRLANGIRTIVVANHRQPVVTISLSMPAGHVCDPEGKSGLADLVATLLTKGTERRTADQLAAEIEGAGGSIVAEADDDFLTVTVSGLSEHAAQLFDILGDVVQHATFPAAEVDLARTQALSALTLSLSRPAAIADRFFRQQVYGPSPYGRVVTRASLQSLTRDDVAAFDAARIKPAGALLVVAGDLTPARVAALASQSLGGWRGAPEPPPPAAAIPARASSEIVLVHKPGAVQSNIVAGFPFITPRNPDGYALTIANRILGGGTDSRLFLILREQKGWTYGAYSSYSQPRGIGAFEATAEVRTPVTDSALAELLRQLDRMRTEAPPDSEIANAKNYLIGHFPLTIETADQIAARVASARLLGRPDDYVQRYRERLAAVTAPQIAAAARRYLTTDHMVVLVVGDGTKILPGLKAQGLPIRILDVDGAGLTEADLAPRASAVSLQTGRLAPGTYEYRVMVQGNAFGSETRTISRAQEGGRDAWQVVSETSIGPILHQLDTTVVDAATLAPIRVRQSGTQAGQETFVRLDYAGGRVRGTTRTMRRPGQPPQDVTIDTTLAAGTFDDNQMGLLIMALPWTANARWTLPVFSGGAGESRTLTVAVTGQDSVTVPAGTFACWRVQVQGGEQNLTLYVAREQPVFVKLEIEGAPVSFELTRRN